MLYGQLSHMNYSSEGTLTGGRVLQRTCAPESTEALVSESHPTEHPMMAFLKQSYSVLAPCRWSSGQAEALTPPLPQHTWQLWLCCPA